MISKCLRSSSSTNLVHYILDGTAHDKTLTDKRNLMFGAYNVDKVNNRLNSTYTASQFWAVQQRAKNKNKKTKAYHLIFSFSEQDFPLPKDAKELHEQAKDAGILVYKFMQERLGKDAQLIAGVQRDGQGHMLHVHVAVNSVLKSGKVLNTNLLTMTKRGKNLGLRHDIDKYLVNEFPKLTGRSYKPVEPQQDNLVNYTETRIKDRERAKNNVKQAYSWKEHLKSLIYNAFNASSNLKEFKQACKQNGVSISERRASVGKDATGKKLYRNAYTYSFTGADGKNYKSRDYVRLKLKKKSKYTGKKYNGRARGLGLAFTPEALEKEFEYEYQQKQSIAQRQQYTTASNTIRQLKSEIASRVARPDETAETGSTKTSTTGSTETNTRSTNERTTNSTTRSKGSIESADSFFDIGGFESLAGFEFNDANSHQSTKTADESVKDKQKKQGRENSANEIPKPDISTIIELRDAEYWQGYRETRDYYEKLQRMAKDHDRGFDRSGKDYGNGFNRNRSENGTSSQSENQQNESRFRQSKEQELNDANPFDDMF